MCKRNGNDIEWCRPCIEILDEQKGMHLWNMVDIRTGKTCRRLLVAKLGDHRKKGIVFNHCPFNGEDILVTVDDLENEKTSK